MAEAFYGVPEEIIEQAKTLIPSDMQERIDEFYGALQQRVNQSKNAK